MHKDIDNIISTFQTKPKFKCLSCSDEKAIIVECYNSFSCNEIDNSNSNDLIYFLDRYTPATLYYLESNIDEMAMESGIILFSQEKILAESNTLFSSNIQIITEHKMLLIGEDCSTGNKIIAKNDSSTSIFFVRIEEIENIKFIFNTPPHYQSISLFLEELSSNPEVILSSDWRFYKGFMNQWYPEQLIK